MGFFKNIWNGVKKVATTVAKPVTKLADTALKMIPGVGNIYSTVSNLTGIGLDKVGDLIAGNKKEPVQEVTQAENIIQDLQVDQPITRMYSTSPTPITNMYGSNPTYNNGVDSIKLSSNPITSMYDPNPLLSKAFVLSGTTNEILTKALEKNGISIDNLASLGAELKERGLL